MGDELAEAVKRGGGERGRGKNEGWLTAGDRSQHASRSLNPRLQLADNGLIEQGSDKNPRDRFYSLRLLANWSLYPPIGYLLGSTVET
jgi:hypothetical protein